jgi:hypothetical protein
MIVPYLADHGIPVEPQDLTHHRCCNIRLPTSGGFYGDYEGSIGGKAIRWDSANTLIRMTDFHRHVEVIEHEARRHR